MHIENIIEYADDKKHRRRAVEKVEGIMLHRVGVNLDSGIALGYDGRSICDAFLGRIPGWKKVAEVTGSQNAYTFYVGGDLGPSEYDGKIWQALPLDEVGNHGRRFSVPYVGVGLIFDGRHRQPSTPQYHAVADLVAELCVALGLDAYKDVKGHGEVPGAHGGEKAPGQPHACPGHNEHLKLNVFRDDVAMIMRTRARRRLDGAGLIFEYDYDKTPVP